MLLIMEQYLFSQYKFIAFDFIVLSVIIQVKKIQEFDAIQVLCKLF